MRTILAILMLTVPIEDPTTTETTTETSVFVCSPEPAPECLNMTTETTIKPKPNRPKPAVPVATPNVRYTG